MAVRIGPDGTIITSESQSSEPTILEDGTIEISGNQQRLTTSGNHSNGLNLSSRTTNVISGPAPVSPLENVESSESNTSASDRTITSSQNNTSDSLGDLEYAAMVEEGKIRSSSPRTGILVAVICTLVAILFSSPVFFIGTAVGVVIIVMKKKEQSAHIEARDKLRAEIEEMKQRS